LNPDNNSLTSVAGCVGLDSEIMFGGLLSALNGGPNCNIQTIEGARRMAQKVHIVLEDDLDGSPATETVSFGLDGKTYEIDLNDKNAGKRRDPLAQNFE